MQRLREDHPTFVAVVAIAFSSTLWIFFTHFLLHASVAISIAESIAWAGFQFVILMRRRRRKQSLRN